MKLESKIVAKQQKKQQKNDFPNPDIFHAI